MVMAYIVGRWIRYHTFIMTYLSINYHRSIGLFFFIKNYRFLFDRYFSDLIPKYD